MRVSRPLRLVAVLGALVGTTVLVAEPTPSTARVRPSASWPKCPTHDPTKYHTLVDIARRCHYDHEHKDDPHVLDRRFGKPGKWFGGTEISFPWQTFAGAGEAHNHPGGPGTMENDLKHQGYAWGVRTNIPCRRIFGATGCLTDLRFEVHALPTARDATARFHSFSIEARGCVKSKCGIIREGGWIDYGVLRLDIVTPTEQLVVPLPGDPAVRPEGNPQRLHKTTLNNQRDITWYTQGGDWNQHRTWLGLRFEGWSPIDPNEPSRELDYCSLDGAGRSRCEWNGSWIEVHLVPITVPASWDTLDGRQDGQVTYRGFTDRYGTIVTGCRRAGLDCVPLQLEHFPVGYYQYRDDAWGKGPIEHDLSPAGTWWISYPAA